MSEAAAAKTAATTLALRWLRRCLPWVTVLLLPRQEFPETVVPSKTGQLTSFHCAFKLYANFILNTLRISPPI
jgi:hypothetical protein